MAQGKVHVGDIGTTFRVQFRDEDGDVIDVSSASTMEIRLEKPNNGTVTTKTGVHTTDGTDGQIEYVSVSGDIDVGEDGLWSYMGKAVVGTATWHSDTFTFRVHPILS